jgi:hypothetical protein
MTTTWTTSTSLLSFLRQAQYDGLFDTDDDGTADDSAVTYAIRMGAIKLNHFNTNFNTDTKELINNLFAVEFAESIATRIVGPMPDGVQKQIDYWNTQLENYSSVTTEPCFLYDPEEGVTQDYLDSLIEDPE